MEIDNVPATTEHDPMDEDSNEQDNVAFELIDQLNSEDQSVRLEAIDQLPVIAKALGPERTRDELVPFLKDFSEEEEEILRNLAFQLGELRNTLDRSELAQCLQPLLELLEKIAENEDQQVREKATSSLCEIAKALPEREKDFIGVLKRLSEAEFPTGQAAATRLYETAYEIGSEQTRNELFSMFKNLVVNDYPMVRRSATKVIGRLAGKIPQTDDKLQSIIALYQTLAKDDQDSVRVLAAEALEELIKLLTDAHKKESLLPTFRDLATDKSWRVRYMVASHYVEIAEALGEAIVREEFTNDDIFTSLLNDSEGDVRIAAASKIPGYAKLRKITDKNYDCKDLLTCVETLVNDENQHVRAALAVEIINLAPIVGKEVTAERLLPIFNTQLKDDFPDVRLNIIKKLRVISGDSAIGIEKLSEAVGPAIKELAGDHQWRTRKDIIDHIHLLAKQFGQTFFEEQLFGLCMDWLYDEVFAIREAAAENLKKLTEVFEPQWAKEKIIGPLIQRLNDGMETSDEEKRCNDRRRMTTLFALTTVAEACPPNIVKESILPTIISLSSDRIPNIRFNAAKSLEKLIPLLKKDPSTAALVTEKVKPVLDELHEDEDCEVKFYASRALKVL